MNQVQVGSVCGKFGGRRRRALCSGRPLQGQWEAAAGKVNVLMMVHVVVPVRVAFVTVLVAVSGNASESCLCPGEHVPDALFRHCNSWQRRICFG